METIKVQWEDIPHKKQSKTPFLTHCRRLIKQGVNPNSRVEFWDKGKLRMFTDNVGEAAKWTVLETDKVGPYFVPFDPPKMVAAAL